jgi:hypothetical protein
MQAYEFSSTISDDGAIYIPKQYLGKLASPVKIILLSDDETVQNSKRKHFSAVKMKTKGVKFDRVVANER